MNTSVADRQELVASLLRDIRLKAKLTQSEIAATLGKPQSYVSKYETGERRLDVVELSDLCEALGTSLYEFVAEFEKRQR